MMLDKLKRWRWAVAIGAVLLLGLVYAFWPEAVPVDLGKVSRGEMKVGVTDDGVTRAEEFYVVSAPVTGYLSRIEMEPGDKVVRGSLITTMTGQPSAPLDPRTTEQLRASLSAARAAAAGASASLGQAQRDLARAEQLAGSGVQSRADLEAARTSVATNKAALEQSRSEVRRIEAQLAQPAGTGSGKRVAVRAPAPGEILTVDNKSEGVVPEGTRLVTIGDPSRIEAVVDLLSREAVEVKPGDRVEITQWGGPKPIPAYVKRIEPYGRLKISALGIEEQRVNVIIGFDAAGARQAARLGHGYQIDGTIILWHSKDALRVPIGALFRGPEGGWQVFVDDGGDAELRKVKIGHVNDEYAEVLDGLAKDDTVVLNPGDAVRDGKRITAR